MTRWSRPIATAACANFAVLFPWEPSRRAAGGGQPPDSTVRGGLTERQKPDGKPADQRGPNTLLLALGLVALALFLSFMLAALYTTQAPRRRPGVRCRMGLKQLHLNVFMYMVNSDRHFPLAWHVDGPTLAEDLGNLTFYRLLVGEAGDQGRSRLVSRDDRARFGKEGAWKRKFEAIDREWTDETKGWTQDWFAPEIIFRMPDPISTQRRRAVCYDDLVNQPGVIAADRPLMSDVNASLPDPQARDPKDPEHEAEMRKGFSTVQAAGMQVFVGAGPSLRRTGDHTTSRFDFRHGGCVNVIFLDGHVDMVKADEKARLEKIHSLWNSLEPSTAPASPPR